MRVELYDTTLRDGSQMEGVSFSLEDKLRITEKLDEFGIHYIEGGLARLKPEGHRVLPRRSGCGSRKR